MSDQAQIESALVLDIVSTGLTPLQALALDAVAVADGADIDNVLSAAASEHIAAAESAMAIPDLSVDLGGGEPEPVAGIRFQDETLLGAELLAIRFAAERLSPVLAMAGERFA